jgi:thymidine phosphorylase
VVWKAKKRGFVTEMDTEALGRLLVDLGGGRKKVTDSVDPGVGMIFHRKLGAKVQAGDPIVTAYIPEKARAEEVEAQLALAIEIKGARKAAPKLILEEL